MATFALNLQLLSLQVRALTKDRLVQESIRDRVVLCLQLGRIAPIRRHLHVLKGRLVVMLVHPSLSLVLHSSSHTCVFRTTWSRGRICEELRHLVLQHPRTVVLTVDREVVHRVEDLVGLGCGLGLLGSRLVGGLSLGYATVGVVFGRVVHNFGGTAVDGCSCVEDGLTGG